MKSISSRIGLLGSFSWDRIITPDGQLYEGAGGILYQAAVLAAIGNHVSLYAQQGNTFPLRISQIIKNWELVEDTDVITIDHPGNRVHLDYAMQSERSEILETVVPPYNPRPSLSSINRLSMLICVMNSGYDITYETWRYLVENIQCPIWFDIHSLVLNQVIGEKRSYISLPDWHKWIRNVSYLQANSKEAACLISKPDQDLSKKDLNNLADTAFQHGVRAVFITRGEKGVWVATPETRSFLGIDKRMNVSSETTGCGDVFCAGTVSKLSAGSDPFEAAAYGQRLAVIASSCHGINNTFLAIKNSQLS